MSDLCDSCHFSKKDALMSRGRIVESIYTFSLYCNITKGKKYEVEDVIPLINDGFLEDVFYVITDDEGRTPEISYKCFKPLVS